MCVYIPLDNSLSLSLLASSSSLLSSLLYRRSLPVFSPILSLSRDTRPSPPPLQSSSSLSRLLLCFSPRAASLFRSLERSPPRFVCTRFARGCARGESSASAPCRRKFPPRLQKTRCFRKYRPRLSLCAASAKTGYTPPRDTPTRALV